MKNVIAFVGLLAAGLVAIALITPASRPVYDPYVAQRAQLVYQAQLDSQNRMQARAAALEPMIRLMLAALYLAPLAIGVMAIDAYRLRRRLVMVDGAGRLPMPRRTIESDPRPAIAALAAYHAVEFQRATPPARISVRDQSESPAPSPPVQDAPRVPERLDLMQALRSFTPTPDKLLMGMGANGPIYRSLDQLLHVGILGSSGSGKSTSQLALAVQLAMIESAQLAVLDPEAATFQALRRSSRLFVPFPDDGAACIQNLQALQAELDTRRALLSGAGAWDWQELNSDMGGNMQPIFGFVDELPTLTGYSDTEPRLIDLARRGRKCGMYLVVASQTLKKEDVGSTTIRQQFATKLLLRIGEAAQGQALGIDVAWRKTAAAFDQPGLAVYAPNDAAPELIRIPYVGKAAAAHILAGASPLPRPEKNAEVETVTAISSRHAEGVSTASHSVFSTFPRFSVDMEKAAKVAFLRSAEGGKKRKSEIITEVWGVNGGRKYATASEEYETMITQIDLLQAA